MASWLGCHTHSVNVWLKVMLQQKMDIRLIVFCYSLIPAFPFCSGQFLCIRGGTVQFFMQDSQNHKSLLLERSSHFIQVLLKQGLL